MEFTAHGEWYQKLAEGSGSGELWGLSGTQHREVR